MADIRTFASRTPDLAARAVLGATDERLLNDLLELLSQLEQHRARLIETAAAQADPAALVPLADLVNLVVKFVMARSQDRALLPSRMLASVAEDLPYTQFLGEEDERITASTTVNALRDWTGTPRDRRLLVRDVCEATVNLFCLYCQAILKLFHVDRDREEWRTMSELFVADLRQMFPREP